MNATAVTIDHRSAPTKGVPYASPRQPRNRSAAFNGGASAFLHSEQYDDPAAKFYQYFNSRTGRDNLYLGYMAGHFSNNKSLLHENSKAANIGCGTGWFEPCLKTKFNAVYGIDISEAMLRIAIANKQDDGITYHKTVPQDILGKCDFVSALHVHYHFDNAEKLKKEFFQVAADLLKPGGEFILIGCPSEHIYFTPEHYTNHIHTDDIPEEILGQMSETFLLTDTGTSSGFVALKALPSSFVLKDGTQMKVVFKTADDRGKEQTLTLTDTYWSDGTLKQTAEECGLTLEIKEDIAYRGYNHAYMAMHFRKPADARP